MSLFADTSGLYAVLDADDGRHGAAKAAWEGFLSGRETMHTTNYVLVEMAVLLQGRIGMEALRAFTADMLPVLQVFWVDEGTHRSAHHALLVAARRRLSLVDCVSFEAMRRLGLERVFCFDPHFSEQGFLPLPTAAAP